MDSRSYQAAGVRLRRCVILSFGIAVLCACSTLPRGAVPHRGPFSERFQDTPEWPLLLDALKWAESCGEGKNSINYNRDKRGRVVSIDVGEYQINSMNARRFAEWYNGGDRFDPRGPLARLIAGAYLYDMIRATGSIKGGLIAYNCGFKNWKHPPKSSILHAERIIKRWNKLIINNLTTMQTGL